jgi:hypothetical protein
MVPGLVHFLCYFPPSPTPLRNFLKAQRLGFTTDQSDKTFPGTQALVFWAQVCVELPKRLHGATMVGIHSRLIHSPTQQIRIS